MIYDVRASGFTDDPAILDATALLDELIETYGKQDVLEGDLEDKRHFDESMRDEPLSPHEIRFYEDPAFRSRVISEYESVLEPAIFKIGLEHLDGLSQRLPINLFEDVVETYPKVRTMELNEFGMFYLEVEEERPEIVHSMMQYLRHMRWLEGRFEDRLETLLKPAKDLALSTVPLWQIKKRHYIKMTPNIISLVRLKQVDRIHKQLDRMI